MRRICIIPAKLSSTRLPRKNLLPIGKYSLLQHAITKSILSKCFDSVVVTSESEEVLSESTKYHSPITLQRPLKLSKDPASIGDVCCFVINSLNEMKSHDDLWITIVLPTSPFTRIDDISNVVEHSINHRKSIISVRHAKDNPVNLRQSIEYVNPYIASASYLQTSNSVQPVRQSTRLTPLYTSNGCVASSSAKQILETNQYHHDDSLIYIMPFLNSIDIDYEHDYLISKVLSLYDPSLGDLNKSHDLLDTLNH